MFLKRGFVLTKNFFIFRAVGPLPKLVIITFLQLPFSGIARQFAFALSVAVDLEGVRWLFGRLDRTVQRVQDAGCLLLTVVRADVIIDTVNGDLRQGEVGLAGDGPVRVIAVLFLLQPHGPEGVGEDCAGGSGDDDRNDCHGEQHLAPLDPLLLNLGADVVAEVAGVQEHRATNGGLDRRFGDPSEAEEHLLMAGELGLAGGDDGTHPAHGDAEEDDDDVRDHRPSLALALSVCALLPGEPLP